jgi:hypothetical protein
MIFLVLIEAPLASVFTTAYLGDVMFHDRPPFRVIVQSVARQWFAILWCIVILRGPAAAVFLAVTADRYEDPPAVNLTFLGFVAFGAAVLRATRPYVLEVILLERNELGWPRFKKKDPFQDATIGQRSAALQDASRGDLIGRWLGIALAAGALTVAIQATIWFFLGIFLNSWTWGPVMTEFCAPLSMWLVACYFTVVRYLSYLDLRIRTEGWEVELRLRAEAARLTPERELKIAN